MKKRFVQTVLIWLVVFGVAGCVVPTPAADAPTEITTTPETRTFTHALGETEITGRQNAW